MKRLTRDERLILEEARRIKRRILEMEEGVWRVSEGTLDNPRAYTGQAAYMTVEIYFSGTRWAGRISDKYGTYRSSSAHSTGKTPDEARKKLIPFARAKAKVTGGHELYDLLTTSIES